MITLSPSPSRPPGQKRLQLLGVLTFAAVEVFVFMALMLPLVAR
jgi:hypothetical protein